MNIIQSVSKRKVGIFVQLFLTRRECKNKNKTGVRPDNKYGVKRTLLLLLAVWVFPNFSVREEI